MLGEDAGSCLRIVSNDGNRYNKAVLGYVLQSHVRVLCVVDDSGTILARSLIRLVLRSDTLTPVIFADPIFFNFGYTRALQRELLAQARVLEAYMGVPVVHSGSALPLLDGGELAPGVAFNTCPTRSKRITVEGYVREVSALGYNITWVELLEMDGVAPYTYSEELPYDDLLNQHRWKSAPARRAWHPATGGATGGADRCPALVCTCAWQLGRSDTHRRATRARCGRAATRGFAVCSTLRRRARGTDSVDDAPRRG